MIIASAGHVDHGKTSLVKALTGIDTDRLAEEQRRGMTIELGFAYVDWASGDTAFDEPRPAAQPSQPIQPTAPIGFVDVPGHERFVRHMLAGVAGIDMGLLVVAADDGPMPQTHEHLAILALLGVPRLVVVLSKIDRVAPDRLAQAQREIDALLADGPYAAAPRFEVAATAQIGVAALRRHLTDAARALAPRTASGHFRLAIDRSFTLAGAGRVVTGMVLSGQVRVGDEVIVSPTGTAARVRSLHAQNQPAQLARAGQRCALNLAGPELKRAEPQRGDWLLAPAAHAPSDRLDVQLQVLASEAVPLSQRTSLQLHLGAAMLNARVAALAGHSLTPGSTGLAQLVLDRPVAAAHGDRFILRDPAANRSLAGGWVIDPSGPARGRAQPKRLAQLAALMRPDPKQALAELLTLDQNGVDVTAFARSRNLRTDESETLHQALSLRLVNAQSQTIGLTEAQWTAWREQVLAALDGWHSQHPHSLGPLPAQIRHALGLPSKTGSGELSGHLSAITNAHAVLSAVLDALVFDKLLARDGLRHRRHDHRPQLGDADALLLTRITALLHAAGLRPPIVGELAIQLGQPLPELLDHLGRLGAGGHLVRVAPNRWYLPATVAELLALAQALAAEQASGSIDAAGFRDRSGIGRNLTVQVLEFFKREGLTRFDGQRHRLLP